MTSRFLGRQAFPLSTQLERHWPEIHPELVGVRAEMTAWFEREINGELGRRPRSR
jgi:predicted component of type VI protein secretion system